MTYDHRDELADRDLADDDLVRGGEERRRLGMLARERPEDELRHRHVGGRVDPVPGDVAEHDGEPAVAQLEEVEDVAADVDLRGGLVDRADLEPGDRRPLARQQRPLHRLRELLLLLVEAGVVDRERGLLADRARGRERLARDRRGRIERDDRQLCEQLARRRDRQQRGRRAAEQEREQQRMGAAEPLRQLRRRASWARGCAAGAAAAVRGSRGRRRRAASRRRGRRAARTGRLARPGRGSRRHRRSAPSPASR